MVQLHLKQQNHITKSVYLQFKVATMIGAYLRKDLQGFDYTNISRH